MRIRKILYFGSTKIFFILTYPLNPLLKKRGLGRYAPGGEYRGCGEFRKKKFYSGRIRKILYFGSTKIF